ncbi:hypothetical protein FA13DRAFT_1789254 [Coprinellus micaceus]|uniref:DUF6534 domain-containing protein n=1 Tax=Coprinellus micaceus TaxID=71717 RepID=A0A4Y7TIP6_COPMI|nr:hypothetical protein FA13DRAFT_1789254 [Coprinellus micaceus]
MGAFDTTLGALLIGGFLNTYLYGLSSFQYGSYWNTDFKDPLWIKASVLSLFIVDTAHTASIVYLSWAYMVENYANPNFLMESFVWPLPASTFVITVIAFGVQNFLAMRIYRLTELKWLLYTFIACSTATLVLGLYCGGKLSMMKILPEVITLRKPLTVWLGLEVAIDSSIAVVLFTVLQRSRTGFRRSDAVLNRLARSAIQSGAFTTVLAIIALACFSALGDTLFYATFGIPCARAYTISMMDTLLCRKELRVLMNGEETKDSFRMTSIPDIFARPRSTTTGTWHISKETETDVRYVNEAETGTTRSRTMSDARGLDDKAPSLVIDVS